MHYPSSENKGADQLRGYREADLRLCFRLGKNPVFSRCGSNRSKHPDFIIYINVVGLYFSIYYGFEIHRHPDFEKMMIKRFFLFIALTAIFVM